MHDSQPLPPYPSKPLLGPATRPLQPHDPYPLPMLREMHGWPEKLLKTLGWGMRRSGDEGGAGSLPD